MSESSEFKFLGGVSLIIGISLASFAGLVGASETYWFLISVLWSTTGLLALKTGRFIERLQARIKVPEAKLPDTESGEFSIEPYTEN